MCLSPAHMTNRRTLNSTWGGYLVDQKTLTERDTACGMVILSWFSIS